MRNWCVRSWTRRSGGDSMSDPNNDTQREPTFTYSIDPKSVHVHLYDRQDGRAEPPMCSADVRFNQYGGSDYCLPNSCSVEYSISDDGVLKVQQPSYSKPLNDAAMQIVQERLDEKLKGAEVPCTGCYDYSCPTHGCPPEKLLNRRQVAERNLREGPQFDETDEEWEREAAGYR